MVDDDDDDGWMDRVDSGGWEVVRDLMVGDI